MGSLLSRWRSKKSTIEILEDLEKDINSLEKLKRSNTESQKKIIGSLILYSVLAYILGALLFYFYYMPEKFQDRLLYSAPLLVFPLLVWLLKRFLHWYFIKRIAKNESALEELLQKKKTILEEVMEKETYKKAKEILEKFDPERQRKLETPAGTPAVGTSGTELRQRTVGGSTAKPPPGSVQQYPGATPHGPRQGPVPGRPPPSEPNQRNRATGMGPPLPRPVLPRERSAAEKVIEYLVGDGPSNRYALICQKCLSHNGMALAEEFEYLGYRCCYCFTVNPPRKVRPNAPRLTFDSPPTFRKELMRREQGGASASPVTTEESEEEDIYSASPNTNSSRTAESKESPQEGSSEEKKDVKKEDKSDTTES